MQCPVCEAENQDDALECDSCGRAFTATDGGDGVAKIDGLELTQLASPDLAVDVQPIPGVEHTRLEEDPGVPSHWTGGEIPLERTHHEPVAAATEAWTADLELDSGREPDSGERTPAAPESATCPFCGTVSLSAICDACGRQKARFVAATAAERRAPNGETTTCPACFARVARDVRCSDCG